MAARIRPQHQDECRARIKVSQLLNRLQDHGLGEIELDMARIKSIEILLRKTLPDLSSTTIEGGDKPLIHQVISSEPLTPEQWAERYKPK